MKTFFSGFLFLFSLSLCAQNISGLYSGTLVNDSTKKVQHYQLALSEYRDKITGYSYTTFVTNDTFYYSIKRVKGKRKGGDLIVEDDKMIGNNFPQAAAKGVRQITTIPLTAVDTLTSFNGSWKTTQTKVYYALFGSVEMKRDGDSLHAPLINHLKELNIMNSSQPAALVKEAAKKNAVVLKPQNVAATVTPYPQRQQVIVQTISVRSDSLVLHFYDNGVVDGDVISVYLNDQPVVTRTKLTEAAIKKTVHLAVRPNGTAALTLVAETLGSLPPNTGLLIVQDGSDRYNVHFSADLTTNATIIFRKRTN